MSRAHQSRSRWLGALGFGALSGIAVSVTLAMNVPLVSSLPIALLVWWVARAGSPFTGLAGFLVGLALGLGSGALAGAGRCAALNAAGGYCSGPDLIAVAAIAGLPTALAVPFALLGRSRQR